MEEKILSYLDTKSLSASMLVCKEWCQKAKPFLCEWYATIQRKKKGLPLERAVNSGYHHLVAFFLRDKQFKVNEISEGLGWTTLMMAVICRWNKAIIRMLLDREDIDVNIKSRHCGLTALSLAAKYGHVGTVKILIKRQDILVNSCCNDGDTALILAALKMKASVVKELLNHPDIDVNIQDQYGRTALSYAKMQNNVNALEEPLRREEIIKMLVKKNAL